MSEEQLRADAELLLPTSGLDVVGEHEFRDADGKIFIDISSVSVNQGESYAVHVSVEFWSEVMPLGVLKPCGDLVRSSQKVADKIDGVLDCITPYRLSAQLWARDELWVLGRQKLESARQSAKDMIEEFAVDWLKANPPKVN